MYVRGIKQLVALVVFLALAGCTTNSSKYHADRTAYESYSRLGFEYLQAGDTTSAKSAFHRSIVLNSGYAEAHNGLALTFQLEGDHDLAEEYFRKATRLAPDSAMMHNNFGAFLFAKKRYQEACIELARATEDPFYNRRSQAFENLGRCYSYIERNDAAEHAFKRALQVSSSARPVSLVELTDLALKKQNLNQAEEYFGRFLEGVESRRFEHYAKSLWVGIQMARLNGNHTRAAAYALILKNLYPDSEEYEKYKESTR
jgi:type IV pilus assembly protein PilF